MEARTPDGVDHVILTIRGVVTSAQLDLNDQTIDALIGRLTAIKDRREAGRLVVAHDLPNGMKRP